MSDSGARKDSMSFWEHLDVLKTIIIKCVAVALGFGCILFCFKDTLFNAILAPGKDGFITYNLLNRAALAIGQSPLPSFSVPLINTGLAQQFMIHMKVAFSCGVLLAFPYILYQLYRFVSPALYARERQYASGVVGWAYLMFMAGAAVSYLLIFPFTFRFLGMYQVSDEVPNMITLESYISTLLVMCLTMGIVFEIPVLSWLFAKFGFLNASWMRRFRKHAIVTILIVAAVITPTSDVFTLLIVSLPMWLLYEASILIVRRAQRSHEVQVQISTSVE